MLPPKQNRSGCGGLEWPHEFRHYLYKLAVQPAYRLHGKRGPDDPKPSSVEGIDQPQRSLTVTGVWFAAAPRSFITLKSRKLEGATRRPFGMSPEMRA